MNYELFIKFKKFKGELTRRLQEYYKTNYNYDAVVQDIYESRNFKINSISAQNCLRIYFKRDKVSLNDSEGFNFPIDELRIRNTYNGNMELFQVDFNYRSTSPESYSLQGNKIDSLLDVVAKYYKPEYETLTDYNTHEDIHPDVYIDGSDAMFSYKISTSQGEKWVSINAYRDSSNKRDQYFKINFHINYGYSK